MDVRPPYVGSVLNANALQFLDVKWKHAVCNNEIQDY